MKRVKDHDKKIKRAAKKNPESRKKLKKDPGIPNLWPQKMEMLQELKKQREAEKQEKQKKKAEKKAKKLQEAEQQEQDMIETEDQDEVANMSQMAKLQFEAMQKANDFEAKQNLLGDEDDDMKDVKQAAVSKASKRTYYREFKKVVDTADVIMEVLDARDPLGCRCPDIEKAILSSNPNKKIVLLMNKIDLVPREVVQKWLAYFRKEFPTIAFKSNTQKQKSNMGQYDANKADRGLKHSGVCLGASTLLQLLKNYSRSDDIKKTITVGIIGYPNVGKSSVINSLKRSRAVNVGSTPGLTKSVQEIHLDQNIKLLDCPGIVFSNSAALDAEVILRNAVRVEQLEDTVAPVEQLLKRCKKERLMAIYNISDFSSAEEFLTNVAKSRGYLKKGGTPKIQHAGRVVLKDWNSGKIPYFTLPPAEESLVDQINKSNQMMQDVETIEQADLAKLRTLKECMEQEKDLVPMISSVPGNAVIDVETDDEDMDQYADDFDDSEEEVEVEDDDDDDVDE